MPNTNPPICSGLEVVRYRDDILALTQSLMPWFKPLMTIKLTDVTTEDEIVSGYNAGAVAGKIYPAGVTTHSQDGFTNFKRAYHLFEKMEELGMRLLIHGESPKDNVLITDREKRFYLRFEKSYGRFHISRLYLNTRQLQMPFTW